MLRIQRREDPTDRHLTLDLEQGELIAGEQTPMKGIIEAAELIRQDEARVPAVSGHAPTRIGGGQ